MADETFKGMLMEYTVERLRQLARDLGVKGYSHLNKEELVSLLLEKVEPALLKERLYIDQGITVSPAPAAEIEKKGKRLSKIAIWASILGFAVGVIALVVALILSSSSDKQLKEVNTKIDKFDPLKVKEKDDLLTEKEKKIKELEKAIKELCVGAPQERQEALAELQKGNMEKARELLKKAISTQCGIMAADYYQLGNAYFADKKPDYRAALAAYLEADRLAPGNGKYINMVGRAYDELGEYGRAKEYYEKALAIDEKVYGKEHPAVAIRLNNLGSAYDDLGDTKKAITYYQQALDIDEKVYGKEHPNVAIDLNNLGTAYWNLADYRTAITYYQQALAIVRKTYGEQHPYVASTLNNLGEAWRELGDPKKAITYYQQALDIDENVYGKEHPNVATDLNNLGSAYWNLGDNSQAITYYQQALAIKKKVYGEDHPSVATGLNNLGSAYYQMGQKDIAKPYFEKAYAIRLKMLGKDHPISKATKEWLELCK